MALVRKKVIVRTFAGDLVWGYLPANGFVSGGLCEVLDPAGRSKMLILSDIKTISYVKDFNLDDSVDPERMGRKSYLGRPRNEGLWLRLVFRDDDSLEGLVHFDTSFMDALLEDRGLTLSPPDARANTLRVFVPRAALSSLQVLGFVAPPAKRKALERAAEEIQAGLFGE